ncbi:MAG: hypothetical protein DCC71_19565 [Proteobacteria bacterium]|nr:MAG: hypothetical protein DCC71_19565 [Pseudomonadota bacterium]
MATNRLLLAALATAALLGAPAASWSAAFVQCPGDTDGDAVIDDPGAPELAGRDVQCQHLTGGDGFIRMGDGRELYVFGFSDVTGLPQEQVLAAGIFRTNFPAPTIRTREGQELYLTLTNVGTHQRPDLFDPHTVHYHGFPNASAIFDGLPESAIAINQGASFTYYYQNIEPGTYMYHCHVEATEHMQMGMLGNLYVEPLQNRTGYGGDPDTVAELEGGPPSAPLGYVYNDGDGSTGYDVELAVQLAGFDHDFHDASENVQPLPFAAMVDTYPMLNGRGYPDTVTPGPLPKLPESRSSDPISPQRLGATVSVTQGQRLLLRLSNLGVVRHYTLTALGLPMRVVGHGARLLRGAGQSAGANVFVDTSAVTLGGGESADVLIDTSGVAPGTYFLYTTNLNYLSNDQQDFGGMMTEIVVQ